MQDLLYVLGEILLWVLLGTFLGFLLGWWLWGSLKSKWDSLQGENKKLRKSAEAANVEHSRQLGAQKSDLNGLKGKFDNSQNELQAVRGKLEAAIKAKDSAEGKRQSAAHKLAEAEKARLEAERSYSGLSGKLKDLEARAQSAGALEAERDALKAKFAAVEPKLGLLGSMQSDKAGLEKRLVELEREKADFAAQLAEANAAAANAPAADATVDAGLQAKVDALTADKAALEAQLTEARSASGGDAELSSRVDRLMAEKAGVEARSQELAAKLSGLEGESNELRAQLAEVQPKLKMVADAEAEKARLQGQIAQLEGKLTDIEKESSSFQSQIAGMAPKLARLTSLEDVNSKLQNRVVDLEGKAAAASSAIDPAELAAVQARAKTAEQSVEERNAEVTRLKAKLAETSSSPSADPAELVVAKSRIVELEEMLKGELGSDHPAFGEPHKAPATVDAQALIAKDFAGKSVRADDDYGILYTSDTPDHTDDLKKIKGIGPVLEGKLNEARVYCFKQVANWSDHHVSCFAKRLDCFPDRIERDRWLPQAAAFACDTSTAAPSFEGEDVKTDETLGILYSSRPSTVDDLKTIKGVGPIIEEKLNEFGVYRFKQMAMWNDATIAAFAEKLATFPDRIERDEWIKQAKELARG